MPPQPLPTICVYVRAGSRINTKKYYLRRNLFKWICVDGGGRDACGIESVAAGATDFSSFSHSLRQNAHTPVCAVVLKMSKLFHIHIVAQRVTSFALRQASGLFFDLDWVLRGAHIHIPRYTEERWNQNHEKKEQTEHVLFTNRREQAREHSNSSHSSDYTENCRRGCGTWKTFNQVTYEILMWNFSGLDSVTMWRVYAKRNDQQHFAEIGDWSFNFD